MKKVWVKIDIFQDYENMAIYRCFKGSKHML